MPRKYTTEQHIIAFWLKVNKDGPTPQHCSELGPCWEWTGYIGKNGYGYLRYINRVMILPHRLSWVLSCGDIPDDLFVLHSCDNRKCVNPTHLFLGTAKDNTHDMDMKNRRGKHAKVSTEDVENIRSIYRKGGITQSELGKKYGISQTHVGSIVRYDKRIS